MYSIRLKPKTNLFALEEPVVEEKPKKLSRNFLEGSGTSSQATKQAFRALSAVVMPSMTYKSTLALSFYSALRDSLSSPAFIDHKEGNRRLKVFPFKELLYEIPTNVNMMKKSLLEESGVFNFGWSVDSAINDESINDFVRFMRQYSVTTVMDYDNICRTKNFVRIGRNNYVLFPRLISPQNPGLHPQLLGKLAFRAGESDYSGENYTKGAIDDYLSEKRLEDYYDLFDSGNYTFDKIKFTVDESDRELEQKFRNVDFTKLKQVIAQPYFHQDLTKEFEVLETLMCSLPYYKELPYFKKFQLSPNDVLRKIFSINGQSEMSNSANEFRQSMNRLLQDLAVVNNYDKKNWKNFYYLLDAIIAIKYYYLKDVDRQISDKVDLDMIDSTSFDISIAEKKGDFVLIPKRQYTGKLPRILVEFDGEQHYRPKAGRNFVRIKMYDAIKNNFFNNAPNHAIIRVPYNLVGRSDTFDYKGKILDYIRPRIDQILEKYELKRAAFVKRKFYKIAIIRSSF